jgi:hypothetical protein
MLFHKKERILFYDDVINKKFFHFSVIYLLLEKFGFVFTIKSLSDNPQHQLMFC